MTENKISEAGTKSADPAQQHLREQKAIWNAAAKALIAKLIYFKRGMNGRGEPKAGLPASKIQFPLPAEIGSYLDGIATDFAAIVDGAEAIIQEQEHYSQVRRKPQQRVQNMSSTPANSNTVPMAAADDGLLVAEASWFGSRLWAKTVGLRGKGKEHLVGMIVHANEIRKTLEDLENLLTSSNANSIASAVNAALILGNSSIKTFEKEYQKYNELCEKIEEKEQEERTKNGPEITDSKNPEPQTVPTATPVATPIVEPKPVEVVQPGKNIQDPEIHFYELREQFQLASEDLKIGMKVILAAVPKAKEIHDADPKDKYYSNLLDYKTDLVQKPKVISMIKETVAKGRGDAEKFKEAMVVLERFLTAYRMSIQICSKILKIEIPLDKWNSYDGFKALAAGLSQTKQAGVKSYLKTRWMKFVNTIIHDKIDSVKIQSLDKIVVALDNFNTLLDTLETKGSRQHKIKIDVEKAFKQLNEVYLTLLTLSDLHNSERNHERINSKRNVTMLEIREKDMRKLREIMNMITSMIKTDNE